MREAVGVLVEHDVALVLDELALLEDAVDLSPATWTALQFDPALAEALAKGISGFPAENQEINACQSSIYGSRCDDCTYAL